jgi:Animal haem peroxidase
VPSTQNKTFLGNNPGAHGSLRGADVLHQSRTHEGRFGRMFRALPAAEFDYKDLVKLAGTGEPNADAPQGIMANPEAADNPDGHGHLIPIAHPESEGADDEENFGIAAGYTYLGQFIDHDITFDPMSSLMKANDPEAMIDFRTPRLDLDCIYGRGPDDQPYMYEARDRKFATGDLDLTRNGKATKAKDLPRFNKRALIGDKRNDENVIISQLQGAFLMYHNALADQFPTKPFEEIQRLVRWHYQWIVLHDFLPKIVGVDTLHSVLPHLKSGKTIHEDKPKLAFFTWHSDPFMPIEFSAAAYRFGHSMVRPIYRLSTELDGTSDEKGQDHSVAGRKFIFAAVRKRGLNGFQPMVREWAIDWSLFFETGGKKLDPNDKTPSRVQPAYKFDTSLVNPLAFLPEFSEPAAGGASMDLEQDKLGFPKPGADPDGSPKISNLALRNLLRGQAMGLPSGQTVARHMCLPVIETKDIKIGKAIWGEDSKLTPLAEYGPSFSHDAPLWLYVLAEAQNEWFDAVKKRSIADPNLSSLELNATPMRLGKVGGRIVAEVLIGLLLGDRTSFLSAEPGWKPNPKGKYGMPDLLEKAGL